MIEIHAARSFVKYIAIALKNVDLNFCSLYYYQRLLAKPSFNFLS